MTDQETTTLSGPPATATEQLLAGFWEELLDVQDVGRGDRLVELGGNSLVATMFANRVEEALGYRPSITEIFSHPLGELAAICERGGDGEGADGGGGA